MNNSNGRNRPSSAFCVQKRTVGVSVGTILALLSVFFPMLILGQSAQISSQKVRRSKPVIPVDLYGLAHDVTVQVIVSKSGGVQSIGSGVWVSRHGLVVTCWHVVKDAVDRITINHGASSPEGAYKLREDSFVTSLFYSMAASLVNKDEQADIAVLATDVNPFVDRSLKLTYPGGEIQPHYAAAQLDESIPNPGEQALLAGYPLGRTDLLIQPGTVSGAGVVEKVPNPHETLKYVRVLLSLVSNPANSGGPVLGPDGKLIGLLQGNLRSPMIDENQRGVLYVRPKLDIQGNVLRGADNNPLVEIAPLAQNSGISMVIPSRLIAPLIKEAEAIVIPARKQQSESTPEKH